MLRAHAQPPQAAQPVQCAAVQARLPAGGCLCASGHSTGCGTGAGQGLSAGTTAAHCCMVPHMWSHKLGRWHPHESVRHDAGAGTRARVVVQQAATVFLRELRCHPQFCGVRVQGMPCIYGAVERFPALESFARVHKQCTSSLVPAVIFVMSPLQGQGCHIAWRPPPTGPQGCGSRKWEGQQVRPLSSEQHHC
jgi:hypothetical protein